MDTNIYETPESWGNDTVYANRNTMESVIDTLRVLGDDWTAITIEDCRKHEALQIFENAVITVDHCIFRSSGNGYYELLVRE